jgi:hypothetical protein
MFRKEPQAFIALPQESVRAGVQHVIEETLAQYGVRSVCVSPADVAVGSAFTATLQDLLRDSDFVIADITGANPNVMIEVGVALGMGKGLLLLSQGRSSELPVDLAAHQVAVYKPDDVDSVRKYLELWLRDAVSDWQSSRT